MSRFDSLFADRLHQLDQQRTRRVLRPVQPEGDSRIRRQAGLFSARRDGVSRDCHSS